MLVHNSLCKVNDTSSPSDFTLTLDSDKLCPEGSVMGDGPMAIGLWSQWRQLHVFIHLSGLTHGLF